MPNFLLFSDHQWFVTYDFNAIDEIIASHKWLYPEEEVSRYVIIICGEGPQICRVIHS